MNIASIQAADIGGEGEIVPTLDHGNHFPADAEETPLAGFARRLGLSFWGHQAHGSDFIVVHLAPLEQGLPQ